MWQVGTLQFEVQAHRGKPGPGQYDVTKLKTVNGGKWGKSIAKSELDMLLYNKKSIPGYFCATLFSFSICMLMMSYAALFSCCCILHFTLPFVQGASAIPKGTALNKHLQQYA